MTLFPDYAPEEKLLLKTGEGRNAGKKRRKDKWEAITYYKVLDSNNITALVECQPESGDFAWFTCGIFSEQDGFYYSDCCDQETLCEEASDDVTFDLDPKADIKIALVIRQLQKNGSVLTFLRKPCLMYQAMMRE